MAARRTTEARSMSTTGAAAHRASPKAGYANLLADLPPSHERVLRSMIIELRRRDPDGAQLSRTDDPDELARAVAERIVDFSARWVEHLGPFYDSASVAALLARNGDPITKQAVSKRKGLLSLTTGSGQVVFPAFQFRDRRPVPGMAKVLDELPDHVVSRWTLASWLVSPDVDLDGARPIDVLHDGSDGDIAAVVTAARQWRVALAA